MVPRAVLMRSGLVSINTARQNASKTAVLVNTARQVNAAHLKTIVNVTRSISYLSKTTHSTVKRLIHKNTTFKNNNVNQRVTTVKGKNVNTARPKAVVNAVNGYNSNAVKASACWVSNPKHKVLDHVSKHNSASITLKKFDYVDAQGRSKRDLRLADEEGIDCLSNSIIFEQLALMSQALEVLKTSKPKVKEIVIQEQEEPEKRRKHFTAKRTKEKGNKPPTEAQKRKIMCTYLKNMEGYKLKDLKLKVFDKIHEMFDRAFKRVNTFKDYRTELVERKEKRAGEELIQESAKKQNMEDDNKIVKLKQLMEIIPDNEEVAIDAIRLVVKSPRIVDWKIHK
nr:hypothetical protein [Tanacetum cinerariifolium]